MNWGSHQILHTHTHERNGPNPGFCMYINHALNGSFLLFHPSSPFPKKLTSTSTTLWEFRFHLEIAGPHRRFLARTTGYNHPEKVGPNSWFLFRWRTVSTKRWNKIPIAMAFSTPSPRFFLRAAAQIHETKNVGDVCAASVTFQFNQPHLLSKEENSWVFPKIGVPPNHPFNRVFHYKPSILGCPHFWNHPHKSFHVVSTSFWWEGCFSDGGTKA